MKKVIITAGIIFLFLSCAKQKGEIFDLEVKKTVKLEGLKERVEVVRDKWGVVHIYGSSEEDVLFVQGYIQAHDRLFQMLLLRGLAEGSLSLLNGSSTLPMDVSMRLFNLKGVAEEIYDTASEEDRKLLDSYSAGVNAFLQNASPDEIPFELLFLGINDLSVIPQWTPQDTLAFARLMTFNLSFDDESEWGLLYQDTQTLLTNKYPEDITLVSGMLLDLFALNPSYPLVSFPVKLVYIDTPTPEFMKTESSLTISYSARIKSLPAIKELKEALKNIFGYKPFSNSWAISPLLSDSGNPIIANDPHLQLSQPSVFHEEHLNTRKKGGDLNVGGVIFPGAPGIVIGFNENVAWGETTVGYDVTDFYLEALSTTAKPWKVLRNGEWTQVEERTEYIPFAPDPENGCELSEDIIEQIKTYPVEVNAEDAFLNTEENICILPVTIYEVPGHGPVVGTLFDEKPPLLVSVKWTGFEPTNEIKTFLGFMKAQSIDDAKTAVQNFKVGAQNHLLIDRNGNIGWFPNANVPERDFTTCADKELNPVPPHTLPPFLPVPGDGRCDWKGYLDPSLLPSLENPEDGFIVTANNSPTASTYPYIGAFFDVGYRAYRIVSRIKEKLAEKGKLTPDDMKEIQADAHSNTCDDFLNILVSTLKAHQNELTDKEKEALSYLDGWDCETSSGIFYNEETNTLDITSDETEKKRAIATTIYHTWYSNFVHDTFDDQISGALSSSFYARAIYHITFRPNCSAITEPQPCQATGDPSIKDSPFWDDINTTEKEERDDIVLKAFKEAVAGLSKWSTFSSVSEWLWGRYHRLTLQHLICMTGDCPPEITILNVPSPYDPVFATGFPRHGEQFAVDSSNPGLLRMDENTNRDFTYSSGPSYRMVVEMTPDGPIAYTALPGGNIANPASKHYSDQIMNLWWKNEYKKFAFTEEDIKANAEELLVFLPR